MAKTLMPPDWEAMIVEILNDGTEQNIIRVPATEATELVGAYTLLYPMRTFRWEKREDRVGLSYCFVPVFLEKMRERFEQDRLRHRRRRRAVRRAV